MLLPLRTLLDTEDEDEAQTSVETTTLRGGRKSGRERSDENKGRERRVIKGRSRHTGGVVT